jgi:hypothetical protein
MGGQAGSAMIAVAALVLATGAPAQSPNRDSGSTGDRAQRIATQPARDVGIQRTSIPLVLERAGADPYGLTGLTTCAQLSAAIVELNGVLGRDFDAPAVRRGSRAGQAAEVGGRALVDSVIPFRGVVREVSGSAGAERRLQAAVDAGFARRGFLRGVHRTRGCRTSLGDAR